MLSKKTSKFPLWQFLNQPLFDDSHPLVLNPGKFARLYRLEHLSKCWSLDLELDSTSNPVDEI